MVVVVFYSDFGYIYLPPPQPSVMDPEDAEGVSLPKLTPNSPTLIKEKIDNPMLSYFKWYSIYQKWLSSPLQKDFHQPPPPS